MDQRAFHLGHLRQFKLHTSDWSIYKPQLNNYFNANDINDSDKKRAIFLTMLDEEAYRLLMFLCQPGVPEDEDFDNLIARFDQNLSAGRSVYAERCKFYKAKRHRDESLEEWATRVKKLGATCEFGEVSDAFLRDRFIFGLCEEYLFRFLGKGADLSLEDAVKLAKEERSSDSGSDFHRYCVNEDFSYGFSDLRNFFYMGDWCLYPYVLIDRHYSH